MPKLQSIHGHTIYIVEGPTDASFVARLAHRLWSPGTKFDPDWFGASGHQTLVTEGKENLPEYLKVLPKVSGFNDVKRIIIMQDADDNFEASLASICAQSDKSLQTSFGVKPKENSPCPDPQGRQIIPWVAPFRNEAGDLERVLWEAVARDGHVKCVESFLTCIEGLETNQVRSRWKALVDSYLVTLGEPTYKASHWFQQDQFPWESPAFDELKARLMVLRESDPQ